MAKVVKDFPGTKRGGTYPWDKWLDGQVWELTRGKDFTVSIVNFRSMVYCESKRRGLTARVSLRGGDDTVHVVAKKS